MTCIVSIDTMVTLHENRLLMTKLIVYWCRRFEFFYHLNINIFYKILTASVSRGRARLLSYGSKAWMRVNHIKYYNYEWDQFALSIAFFSKLYIYKKCLYSKNLKNNESQLTPVNKHNSATEHKPHNLGYISISTGGATTLLRIESRSDAYQIYFGSMGSFIIWFALRYVLPL